MVVLITVFHIIISILLIIAVLLQSGKSADLAGAFGGVGSQTFFGPRGAATLLSKITTVLAVLFMISSLSLWIFSARGPESVVKGEKVSQTQSIPSPQKNLPKN
ncbi:MAG: preprotein translocase subunit SecG [Acidobacteriota bacterium]